MLTLQGVDPPPKQPKVQKGHPKDEGYDNRLPTRIHLPELSVGGGNRRRPPGVISKDIMLEVVNSRTFPQGLKSNTVKRNKNNHLRFETNLATSWDNGSEFIQEISRALNTIEINDTDLYPNSRCSRFVIHSIPSTIGNNILVELVATIATEN